MSINNPIVFLIIIALGLVFIYYYLSYFSPRLRLFLTSRRGKEDRHQIRTETERECPNCEGAMEEGYLVGPRGIYWSSDNIMSQMGMIVPGLQEGYFTPGFGFRPQVFKAYRCVKCRTVILEHFYSIGY